jgi:hypothetical protein
MFTTLLLTFMTFHIMDAETLSIQEESNQRIELYRDTLSALYT